MISQLRTTALILLFTSRVAHAYDWNHNLESYVTRCFLKTDVRASCTDLSEPTWGIQKRAELEIRAVDFMGKKFWYGYMKGIEGDLCDQHLKKINHLLRKAEQVCITGWGEIALDGEGSSHWDSLETKFGKVSW